MCVFVYMKISACKSIQLEPHHPGPTMETQQSLNKQNKRSLGVINQDKDQRY